MSTRPERVELILGALIAHDGADRLALAAAINDALEPTLIADDRAAREGRAGGVMATLIAIVIVVLALALLVAGAAWLVVKVWP